MDVHTPVLRVNELGVGGNVARSRRQACVIVGIRIVDAVIPQGGCLVSGMVF